MGVDLTGGLDPQFEYFLPEQPADPEMRDSATLWIMDASGALAFPRVTLDAIGGHWGAPWTQLNMVLGDGRTFRVWEQLPGSAAGPGGEVAIRGAGALSFQCLKPFRRWSLAFDGAAEQSTSARQMAGVAGGEPAGLAFRFEAEMAEPPWLMGGITAEAANAMTSTGAALMGGLRYEQLCRVTGWVRFAGEERRVAGAGMRVRRRGVRRMGGAPGHCQHSALFPSGRAFGVNAFWPAADGTQAFNEGFVITASGERLPARLAEAPWMTRLQGAGDQLPLVFDTPAGRIRIEGQTLLKTFDHHHFEMADTSVLEQGAARYVWDGEDAIGLFERCTLRERIENGAQR
ncbi:hypothetical protein LJR219_003905 [Phenylobacterium sp. LjRoot219]|uniref:hypothetical protein n=1 Tax=Phenylobacterium sp. LjRoot219 TaxID=3342283 RepID=UPI003ECDC553